MPSASPRIALESCRWFRLLLGLALILAVPGFGQPTPTRWRVAEEEEQTERDSSESMACATADGLRLRGRSIAPGKWLPPPASGRKLRASMAVAVIGNFSAATHVIWQLVP